MRVLKAAILPILLFVAVGCGPERLALQPPSTGYGPDDYSSVRRQWTKRGEDYHNVIDGRLQVQATYFSPAFRLAWLARAEEAFAWNGVARTEATQESDDEARKYHRFFLAVATASWGWNNLDRDDSVWQVWLTDDTGRSVQAEKIVRVRSKRPEYKEFFPYFHSLSEGYLVYFPKTQEAPASAGAGSTLPLPHIEPGTREFSLKVAGAPAQITLTWALQ